MSLGSRCSVCGIPLKSEVAVRRRKCRRCFVSEILGTGRAADADKVAPDADPARPPEPSAEERETADTQAAIAPADLADEDELEADTRGIEPVPTALDGRSIVHPMRETEADAGEDTAEERIDPDPARASAEANDEVLRELRRLKQRLPDGPGEWRRILRLSGVQQLLFGFRIGVGVCAAFILGTGLIAAVLALLTAVGVVDPAFTRSLIERLFPSASA